MTEPHAGEHLLAGDWLVHGHKVEGDLFADAAALAEIIAAEEGEAAATAAIADAAAAAVEDLAEGGATAAADAATEVGAPQAATDLITGGATAGADVAAGEAASIATPYA